MRVIVPTTYLHMELGEKRLMQMAMFQGSFSSTEPAAALA